MRLGIALIAASFLASPSFGQDDASLAAAAKAPETRLPTAADFQPPLQYLYGESVVVYKDSTGDSVRYYYVPYMKPDWAGYEERVSELCTSDSTGHHTVALEIEFSSEPVREEIARALSQKSESVVDPGDIFAFPYSIIQVRAGPSRRVVYRFPDSLEGIGENGVSLPLVVRHPSNGVARIESDCTGHANLLDSRDLSGHLYAQVQHVKRNVTTASFRQLFETNAFRKVFRREERVGSQRVISKSRTRSGGFNIGGFFGGGARNQGGSVEVTDTRRAFVSGGIVSDLAKEAATELWLGSRVEYEREGLDQSGVEKLLVDFLLGNSVDVRASFERRENSEWALTASEFGEQPLSKERIDQLIDAKSEGELNLEGSSKVTVDGYSGEEAKRATLSNDDGIQWKRKSDGGWIPVSVDLYAIATADMSQSISAGIARDVVGETPSVVSKQLAPHIKHSRQLFDHLGRRLARLETRLDRLEGSPLLAVVTVVEGKLVEKGSSPGVTYADGLVTFPNPEGLEYVALVSDLHYATVNYRTSTHFVLARWGNSFRVGHTTMDTGGRTDPPRNFTAAVVGSRPPAAQP